MTPSNPSIPELSLIIAAYNEAGIIQTNIQRIVAVLESRPGVGWELILVNDGSSDATGALLDQAAQRDDRIRVHHHDRNYGQGRALRNGFAMARGATVLTWDADLSYHPDYIWQLCDALHAQNADIVLASPYAPGGVVRNVPGYRHFLSLWGNRFLARMSHFDVHTITCVVRAYRQEILDDLCLSSDGMDIQLEIMMKAGIHHLRVVEVPAVLEWDREKFQQADIARVSKMRILRNIRVYLQIGWLFRPSVIFMSLGIALLLPGLWMDGWFSYRTLAGMLHHLAPEVTLRQAFSMGLEESFVQYPQTLLGGGILTLAGLIIVLFSLVFMQNHFHFSELLRQNRHLHQRLARLERQRLAQHDEHGKNIS
ncbi:MAG: glycosyltransferase family 2 protein [Magnetococcales bacterium]|nr:glycosyltransferase family 2 protein [Magnetococcales bacterium]